jgi:Phage integrase, N-terminal SAM-like domain
VAASLGHRTNWRSKTTTHQAGANRHARARSKENRRGQAPALNQGLELTGSAMTLADYMTGTYIPTYLPLLSSSTQDSYGGVISKYLEPRFGDMCLRNLTRQTLQQFFSGMAVKVPYPTISKIERRSVFDSSFRGRRWLPEQESDGRYQAAT